MLYFTLKSWFVIFGLANTYCMCTSDNTVIYLFYYLLQILLSHTMKLEFVQQLFKYCIYREHVCCLLDMIRVFEAIWHDTIFEPSRRRQRLLSYSDTTKVSLLSDNEILCKMARSRNWSKTCIYRVRYVELEIFLRTLSVVISIRLRSLTS